VFIVARDSLLKEHNLYKKETEEQQRRVDKYIADAADEWDLRNQVRCLADLQRAYASNSRAAKVAC
jgi:tubulin-specific chaperone A